MRKRTLGVVLLAGLAMSGAGAFTASNTMTAVEGGTKNVAGYGAATVTGATVTAIDYTHDTTDGSLLTKVDFVTLGDLSTKNARITLWDTSDSSNEGSYACTAGTVVSTGTLLGVSITEASTPWSCTISPGEPIAAFNSLGITVNN